MGLYNVLSAQKLKTCESQLTQTPQSTFKAQTVLIWGEKCVGIKSIHYEQFGKRSKNACGICKLIKTGRRVIVQKVRNI